MCKVAHAVVLLLLFFSPTHAQNLATQWREDDPRLNQKLTLYLPRAYTGELLEKITAKTHVSLQPATINGSDGEPVMVSVRALPLYQVMDALQSLVSYRDAGWRWRRTGSSGDYAYEFFRSSAAQNLAAVLHQARQRDFEAHADLLMRGAVLTEAERAKITGRDPVTRELLMEPSTRDQAIVVASSLTAEQIQKILRGETTVTLKVADLKPEARDAWGKFWKFQNMRHILPDGSTEPVPEPVEIKIQTEDNGVTPVTFLGGSSVFGNRLYDEKWQNNLLSGWVLPGDTRHNLLERRAIRPPLPSTHKPTQQETLYRTFFPERVVSPYAQSLHQMAAGANLSVMAQLPPIGEAPIGLDVSSARKTVGETVHGIEGVAHYLHKWHSDVLLITEPRWFTIDSERLNTPWSVVKMLRAQDQRPTIDQILIWAKKMSDHDLTALSFEFPGMTFVQQNRALLQWLGANPNRLAAALDKTGALVTGFFLEQFEQAAYAAKGEKAPDNWGKDIVAVRLVQQDMPHLAGSTNRWFYIKLVNQKGEGVAGTSGYFAGRPDPKVFIDPRFIRQ